MFEEKEGSYPRKSNPLRKSCSTPSKPQFRKPLWGVLRGGAKEGKGGRGDDSGKTPEGPAAAFKVQGGFATRSSRKVIRRRRGEKRAV